MSAPETSHSNETAGLSAAEATASETNAAVAVGVSAQIAPPAVDVKFADFALHPDINRAIADMGYTIPTPIQAKAIPIVMTGVDVMGAAQTGTGKTAGFALPILHRLMPHATASPSPARHPVRALMLAPTRELADQIYANVREYAKHTPLRVACVYGGVDIKPQLVALRAGCEVLIATPGRLLDHVEQKSVNLGQASILVLDEADRMLDMGFLPDIQRIINLLPKPRQSLMFSATFSEEIKRLANSFMVKPQLLEVARRNTTNENVTQTVYKVESNDAKRVAVAQLVRTQKLSQVIVFSNTKLGTARLARQLIKEGLRADAIHGDKSQIERNKTLEDFKQNKIDILVATDVAARGLDIAELPAVINFDIPRTPEDYVHRIGRTGRAGASGVALSLIAPGEERYLSDIEKLIKIKFKVENLITDEASEVSARVRPYERISATSARSFEGGRGSRRERVRSSLPGHSGDDFFFKPYEDTGPVVVADNRDSAGSMAPSAVKRPARPVPALLGGKRSG
jgi:ATP-dependent RNA helicase RhlE